FPGAVALLAERAGITLRYEGGRSDGPSREELLRVLDWAAGVFRRQLVGPEGEAARAFLEKRGVSAESSEAWKLGYSLDSWDGLLKSAHKSRIDIALLKAA